MLLITTKNKNNVEQALASFTQMAKISKDNVDVLYGTSVAYMVLKQAPSAQKVLKHISALPWSADEAESLEAR